MSLRERYVSPMTHSAQLQVEVPPALQSWIEDRLAAGEYADAADYVRDLMRRDQRRVLDEGAWLRAELEKGLLSGTVEGEAEDVFDRVLAEDPDFRD